MVLYILIFMFLDSRQLPSDTYRKPITSITAILLPLLTLPPSVQMEVIREHGNELLNFIKLGKYVYRLSNLSTFKAKFARYTDRGLWIAYFGHPCYIRRIESGTPQFYKPRKNDVQSSQMKVFTVAVGRWETLLSVAALRRR
jgi:hypothetical protein